MMTGLWTLPNLLTALRILAVPVIALLLFGDTTQGLWGALVVYAMAVLTDGLDGYWARKTGQVSDWGRVLDPLADKFLVLSMLLILALDHRLQWIHLAPALVIMAREFLISALRETLAQSTQVLPVSALARWKTSTQMLALGVLMVGQDAPWNLPAEPIGTVLLWLAASLTAVTAWDYVRRSRPCA